MTTLVRRTMAAVIATAAVTLPSISIAEETPAYEWKNVRVGGGGFIPGIVFSRVEKGLVYLRSDMGGVYRWEDKAKVWIPLQDAQSESSYMGSESIALDPVDPNTVYVAAGMYRHDPAAIMRSRNRGDKWEIFPVPFKMGGNEDGRGLGERLAIDPNQTSTLYFASRHDGLMKSTDSGETWKQLASFPLKGNGLPAQNQPTNAGLSFVVFDPTSGQPGRPSQTLFVGSADPGKFGLYRSDDAGATWRKVPTPFDDKFLPAQAQTDDRGALYITYASGPGPNGVTDGAVLKLDIKTNTFTDITPDKNPNRPRGGYMGLSLDRQRPGALAVATMNRWGPTDTVWRSEDGGATWKDIAGNSERDVTQTPFLYWGAPKPRLGWWMAALAIDPFNSDFATYATGATIYATPEFSKVSQGQLTNWKPWVDGIEQTAIITLCSVPEGAHLLSGFGDIAGFYHDDLGKSPQTLYTNPVFGNTNNIDYAGMNPKIVVRSGTSHGQDGARLAYSEDAGKSWRPLRIPNSNTETAQPQGRRARRLDTDAAIVVNADGSTLMVMTRTPLVSRDKGNTWEKVRGLPEGARPVADRVEAGRFYAFDFAQAKLYISADGGASFKETRTRGLPADIRRDEPTWREAAWPLHATPGIPGDLWFISSGKLLHSTDFGATWKAQPADLKIEAISFGKAPEGEKYPTIFSIALRKDLKSIFRTTDAGKSWQRINDDGHQYGTRFRCISGDPKVFGRVYVGTDGRGIVYGDPVKSGQE